MGEVKSFETFGVPLPLRSKNLYQGGAKEALEGKLAVPEGPLAFLTEQVFLPWLRALEAWLMGKGCAITFVQERYPTPRFRPSSPTLLVKRKVEAINLREFDESNPLPGLQQICELIERSPELRTQANLHNFVTFLEDNLPKEELQDLHQRFSFLNLGN